MPEKITGLNIDYIPSMEYNSFMTAKQAADYLQISSRAVRERCNNGSLLCQRIGHMWLIQRQSAKRLRKEFDEYYAHGGRKRGRKT